MIVDKVTKALHKSSKSIILYYHLHLGQIESEPNQIVVAPTP